MVLTKKELGKLIKEARKIKSNILCTKYTQQMLADEIGKSQSYIGDIESGRTYPSFAILNAIADACNVPIGYFQDYKKTDEQIDKFIKMQLDNLEEDELYKIREAVKKDPSANIGYVDNYLKESPSKYCTYANDYKTPHEAVRSLLKQEVILDFCNINIKNLSSEEADELVEDVLRQLELISYKYRK